MNRPEKRLEDRLAVVALPEFPVQLLLRQHPEWQGLPLAVIERDHPDAPLLVVNALGRRRKLHPGLRLGAARNLVPTLRTGVVSTELRASAIEDLATGLRSFSPRVESDQTCPGVFYIDPKGLGRIYGGLRSWAKSIHQYLRGRRFVGTVVVGFGRFPTYALAKTRSGTHVLRTAAETRALAQAVALADLDLPLRLQEELFALGVRTLGELEQLPPGELRERFGTDAWAWATATEGSQLPLQAPIPADPLRREVAIEPAETNTARVLFFLKASLHDLLRAIADRGETLHALRLTFQLERRPAHHERIEPAHPTRDLMLLVDLVRLRLGALQLASAVEGLVLEGESIPAVGDQLALFQLGSKRDPKAAARALARIRAAFGEQAVTRARLRDAHLPEASFGWEALGKPIRPRPLPLPDTRTSPLPLVRRLFSRPRPFAPSTDLCGPYRVSSGWWSKLVERDYYYTEIPSGNLVWLYFDRPRRQWLQHGVVD